MRRSASKVALLHSALTPEERSEQWRRIRRGEAPIVVGTRSAIFAPVPNLGLILVDEEHDQSYKQEETPRYNARDVAVMRAKLADAVVVLGSATPSLESWQNAAQGKYTRISMSQRVMNRPLPEVELIDMRREFQETGQEHLFSRALIEQTQAALDRGEQALILLNRRGYSFAVMCRACGAKLECQNCAIALTHHKPPADQAEIAREGQRLECHYCGYRRTVPGAVPQVRQRASVLPGRGLGAGRGAADGDLSHRAHRTHGSRHRARAPRPGAAAGPTALGRDQSAGGHADDRQGPRHSWRDAGGRGGLRSCAVHAGLSRRRARVSADDPGLGARGPRRSAAAAWWCRLTIPTTTPSPRASTHDYASFVERELKYRRWMHYPPFGVLANVLVQSEKLEDAAGWSAELGKWFQKAAPEGVRVLGPCTAPVARIKGIYRFHLILKARSRKALNAALRGMLAHADGGGSAAPKSDRGRGCAAADVSRAASPKTANLARFSGHGRWVSGQVNSSPAPGKARVGQGASRQ